MADKLTLELDALRVESYETGDAADGRGTVNAQELILVTRTNCLTTPCCPDTLTCLAE